MKKLSLYVFLGLLWCNVGFAFNLNLRCFYVEQEFVQDAYKMNVLINGDTKKIVTSDFIEVKEYEIIETKLTSSGNSIFYINAHRKENTTNELLNLNFEMDFPKVSFYIAYFDITNEKFEKVHINKLICNK